MKYLIAILIAAAFFRLYGINWDQNQHFHPDERMIVMVAQKVRLPENTAEWQDIFTPNSALNPKFFAYGSLPIYLLKGVATLTRLTDYDQITLLGRVISALFDLGTIIVLYLIAKKLFNQTVGLLAALFYCLAVLPIQLSHFYAVDTPLTFFITLTLFLCLNLIEKLSIENIILVSLAFAASLATKSSALPLVIPLMIGVFSHFKKTSFKKIFLYSAVFGILSLAIFFDLEPFAFIDFTTLISQTLEQQKMTKDAFTFPYTLQYVGITPYFYQLKNIFFWGLGPIIATLSFLGTLFLADKTFFPSLNTKYFILNTFFWVYFLIVGSFAIGFMRYMLPVYPLLCLFAAALFYQLLLILKNKHLQSVTCYLLLVTLLIWPLSFLNIYNSPNTRNLATTWINKNIPKGSKIAIEHWDDPLPVGNAGNYQIITLPLYDPDTALKWEKINQELKKSNYLIIASNRLYVPLGKLTDCQNLPPGRCYLKTADYYQKLFNGNLGFLKVAQFEILPKIPLTNISIDDFSADESFTVYDHPKVMVFQKKAGI